MLFILWQIHAHNHINKPYTFAYVVSWTSQPLSDKWVCDNHQLYDDNHIFLYSDCLAGEIFFFCFPRSFPQILTISGDSIRADIIFSTSWPVSVYTDTTITDTTITDTTITTPATTVSNAAASLTTDIYNYLLFFFFQVSSNHPYHHCYCVQSSTAAATNYFPDSYIFVSHSILTYPPRVPRFPLRFYCRCHHYD